MAGRSVFNTPSLLQGPLYEYYFLPSCVRLLLSLWSAFERVWVLALSVTGSVRLSGLRGPDEGAPCYGEANGKGVSGNALPRSRGRGEIKRKGNVHASGPTGSASASSSGPGYGQWPGIRRPGTVWPVNPAMFDP